MKCTIKARTELVLSMLGSSARAINKAELENYIRAKVPVNDYSDAINRANEQVDVISEEAEKKTVEGSNGNKFSEKLNIKIRNILKKMYPEIELNYTTEDIQHSDSGLNQIELPEADIDKEQARKYLRRFTREGGYYKETFAKLFNQVFTHEIAGNDSTKTKDNKEVFKQLTEIAGVGIVKAYAASLAEVDTRVEIMEDTFRATSSGVTFSYRVKDTTGFIDDSDTQVISVQSSTLRNIVRSTQHLYDYAEGEYNKANNTMLQRPDTDHVTLKEIGTTRFEGVEISIDNSAGTSVGTIRVNYDATLADVLNMTDLEEYSDEFSESTLNEPIIMLNNLFVYKEFRGKSYGINAIDELISKSSHKGMDILLDSYPTDGTIEQDALNKFYRSLGFKEIEEVADSGVVLMRLDKKLFDIAKQQSAGKIRGQADIEAKTVLINSLLQTQDTLPHEYAHHYIRMFINSKIVQEGIKKWGSEEKLVQAIGEQVVKQEGDAYNWWEKFSKWVAGMFANIDKASKEEIAELLTDAFLTRKDLNAEDVAINDSNAPKDKYDYMEELLEEVEDKFQAPKKFVDRFMTLDSMENMTQEENDEFYELDWFMTIGSRLSSAIAEGLKPDKMLKEYKDATGKDITTEYNEYKAKFKALKNGGSPTTKDTSNTEVNIDGVTVKTFDDSSITDWLGMSVEEGMIIAESNRKEITGSQTVGENEKLNAWGRTTYTVTLAETKDDNYEYSGKSHKLAYDPNNNNTKLESALAKEVEKQLGKPEGYYNHILVNKFENGKGISNHKDNEILYKDENGNVGDVAVLSLGETTTDHTINGKSVKVENGSLIEMSGNTPHSVGKSKGNRISVTFRHIPSNKLVAKKGNTDTKTSVFNRQGDTMYLNEITNVPRTYDIAIDIDDVASQEYKDKRKLRGLYRPLVTAIHSDSTFDADKGDIVAKIEEFVPMSEPAKGEIIKLVKRLFDARSVKNYGNKTLEEWEQFAKEIGAMNKELVDKVDSILKGVGLRLFVQSVVKEGYDFSVGVGRVTDIKEYDTDTKGTITSSTVKDAVEEDTKGTTTNTKVATTGSALKTYSDVVFNAVARIAGIEIKQFSKSQALWRAIQKADNHRLQFPIGANREHTDGLGSTIAVIPKIGSISKSDIKDAVTSGITFAEAALKNAKTEEEKKGIRTYINMISSPGYVAGLEAKFDRGEPKKWIAENARDIEYIKDANVVIHESIHALTSKLINQYFIDKMVLPEEVRNAISALNAEFFRLKADKYSDNPKYPGLHAVGDGYWAKNLHEFVAEFMSNPEMIIEMNKIKKGTKLKQFIGKLATLVNLILNELGVKVELNTSSAEVLTNIGILLEETKAVEVAREEKELGTLTGKAKEAKIIENTSKKQDVKAKLYKLTKGC